MRRKHKSRFFIVCGAICLVLLGGTVWLASRTFDWARDLPNRIQIDGDAFADAMREGVHASLKSTDPDDQQEAIRMLADLIAHDMSVVPWTRREFSADLEAATASPDRGVASAASSLLDELAGLEDTSPVEEIDEQSHSPAPAAGLPANRASSPRAR